VSFANAVQAVSILVLAGTLAGLAPAQRAIAVTPVVALRSE
jgi:ABC-type antimicrobial peptide transport system permease subunit